MITYNDTLKNFDEMTGEEIVAFLDDNQIDISSLYQYDGNTIVSKQDSEEDIQQIFASSPVLEEQDWKYLCLKLSARLLTQQQLSESLHEMLISRLGEQEANVLYTNLHTQYKQMLQQKSEPISEKAIADLDELYDL